MTNYAASPCAVRPGPCASGASSPSALHPASAFSTWARGGAPGADCSAIRPAARPGAVGGREGRDAAAGAVQRTRRLDGVKAADQGVGSGCGLAAMAAKNISAAILPCGGLAECEDQSSNGSRIRMVSSRSGLVDSSVTGASTSSSMRRTYFTACAGRSAQLRAPRVEPDQPSMVS